MDRFWLVAICFVLSVYTLESKSSAIQLLAHVESNASDWRMSTFSMESGSGPWLQGIAFNPDPDQFVPESTFTIVPGATDSDTAPNIHAAAMDLGVPGIVAPDGLRFFRTQFTLPEFEFHSPQVYLTIASDEDVAVRFNGYLFHPSAGLGRTVPNWEAPYPSLFVQDPEDFELPLVVSNYFVGYILSWTNSTWNVGVNTLEVIVRNPTGQGEEAGGFAMTFDFYGDAVPEPGSLLALVAVAGVGILRRRPRIG